MFSSDIKNLTIENINTKSQNGYIEWNIVMINIGSLPIDYNYLVNYYDTNKFKALHFTDGVHGMRNIEIMYGDLWIDYLKEEYDKLFI